ncbi:mediator of DNA damage checkpoint protein 1-like isoform X2 [Sabethes cyaneus]|nr:mediator of DNA damage checkpoint protein 1-like isoform X2 [Sabethes cyaneus]
MDLCSHAGILLTDDRVQMQPVPPLEWLKLFGSKVKLVFGSVTCQLEVVSSTSRKSNASMASFFESSVDSIDCSLDEAPQVRSRLVKNKLSNDNHGDNNSTSENQNSNVSKTVTNISNRQENSFLIPATQTHGNESCSSTRNSTSIAEKSRTSLPQASLDEMDDLFFIPETQECIEQPDESQIIAPIGSTIGQGEKEDDFLRFETEDDENTGDGLFNNPYVESQNLLKNMDESYRKSIGEERKSILPDRSVDSISFHGKIPAEETDDDLSKIEWNDSKATSKDQVNFVPITAEDREGSITPELNFDSRPASTRNLMPDNEEERVESATPDLEFDRITPQQPPDPVLVRKLSLRKDAIEDILQQGPTEPGSRGESVTPDLEFPEKNEDEEDVHDPYLQATQALPAMPNFAVPQSISAYDLATQIDPAISSRNCGTSEEAAYDMLTQKMPDEALKSARSLRKAVIQVTDLRQRKGNVSLRANKEFELDPFELATQPLPTDEIRDVYDLQTQPLRRASNIGNGLNVEDLADTIPLEMPRSPPSWTNLAPSDDFYNMQTQPLAAKKSDSSLPLDGTFRPPANSTYRQSILSSPIHDEEQAAVTENDELNISPSSNKENQEETNQHRSDRKTKSKDSKQSLSTTSEAPESSVREELTQSDEEYCLASTMPVAETTRQVNEDSSSVSKKPSKKTKSKDNINAKLPANRNTPSSTKSSVVSGNSEETPLSRGGSSGGDALSFDFNTPDHPFLNAVKKEKILAVSDMIKNRSSAPNADTALSRKYKYIFGDSSDEDQEPNEPVFLKKDSKIQVMKYDKEEQTSTTKSVASEESTKLPERHSKREKKKTRRYSDDESASVASTRSSVRSARSTVSRTAKTKADEAASEPKTRKRKAAETPALPSDAMTNGAPKHSKTGKKSSEELSEPKAGPSKPSEPSAVSKRSKRLKQTTTEDVTTPNDKQPAKLAVNQTVPVVEQRASRARSKRTTAKSAVDKLPSTDEAATSSTSEALNTSVSGSESSSTRKSSRAVKPRMMFTKMSPEPYKRMITRAGGFIVDMPELASMLVSDRVYRTYKFLCAIARGIPIVDHSYLEQVEKKRDFVDPWAYILQDHEMERRFKFNLKKSLSLARDAKIFEGYSVIVTASTKPPPEELQLIVTSAGGRVIKFPSQQPKHADKLFAVSDQQDKAVWPKLQERYPQIEIISTEGLMLSVMQHYKNFRNYRLA